MSANSKGARLWLRPARRRPGHHNRATWIIRDGERQIGTGCGADDRDGAEKALAEYLARKHVSRTKTVGSRDLDRIPIADTIALYASDVVADLARPHEAAQRADKLLAFFGGKMLDDITGALCRAYVTTRGSAAAARRELEDLRAAINHYHREGLCRELVGIWLPPRGPGRERWLTRDEAAKLIRAAWRYRER